MANPIQLLKFPTDAPPPDLASDALSYPDGLVKMPKLAADTPSVTLAPQPPTPEEQQIQNDQNRLQKVRWQQANPWGTPENHPGKLGKLAHAFSTLGNIAGDIFAPDVMARIPGTQLNREMQEEGLTKRLNEETKNEATEKEQGAQTGKLKTDTELEPGKVAAQEGLENVETAEKQQALDMGPTLIQGHARAVDRAIKEGRDPEIDPIVKGYEESIQAIQKQPLPKGKEHVDLQGPGGKSMGGSYDPATGKYYDAAGKEIANPQLYEKPNQAGMVTVVAPDPNNPGGGIVERLGAGAHIAPGSVTSTQFGSMNAPTSQMRNAGQRAQLAAQEIPGVITEVNQLKDQLGPIAGRWSDFMQGKVGAPNAQLAGLRSDLVFLSSAVALAHAVGRLPENLREEFDNMINAPQQSPENIIAVLNHTEKWMKDNAATMGESAFQKQEHTQGGPKAGDVVDGWKFKGGNPADQNNWEQVKK